MIIKPNKHKYSISAMCKILNISRHLVYYKKRVKSIDIKLENKVINIFKDSRNNYGTRKIKVELAKIGYKISRRYIAKTMRKLGLISNYTKKYFKVCKSLSNEEPIKNELNREFNNRDKMEVVVSDLTYVKVGDKWCYICVILDLYNREIVGYSTGIRKDKDLVLRAISSINYTLSMIKILHKDRGFKFKNKAIQDILDTFGIKRSLSKKSCPNDNAVAEANFKIIKVEFIYFNTFNTIDELPLKLFDYINWYNNCRTHSSLGYLTPIVYKHRVRLKVV